MEYDIESILEKYEDDYNPGPRTTEHGPRTTEHIQIRRYS